MVLWELEFGSGYYLEVLRRVGCRLESFSLYIVFFCRFWELGVFFFIMNEFKLNVVVIFF